MLAANPYLTTCKGSYERGTLYETKYIKVVEN